MNVFKVKVGDYNSFEINKKNFEEQTNKLEPYYNEEENKNPRCYGVCPVCENPIQIIGLYKIEKDVKNKKPYGRHNKGDIERIAKYDERSYFNCPYANPKYHNPKAKRKKDNKTSHYLYNLMKNNYDKAIFYMEKMTGIKFSKAFAKHILSVFVASEAYRYYGATYNNLPFMLFEGTSAKNLTGRYIYKNSNLYRALKQNDRVILTDGNNKNLAKVTVKDKAYKGIDFRLMFHEFNIKQDGTLEETFLFSVLFDDFTVAYKEKITVDQKYFHNLLNYKEFKRNEYLLNLAQELM